MWRRPTSAFSAGGTTVSAEQKGRFIYTKTSTIPGNNTPCVSLWIPLTVANGTTSDGY
jgi:hypothetical protein